jgi:hypothetical protein
VRRQLTPGSRRPRSCFCRNININAGRDASRGRTWPTAVCRKSMHRIAARASHRAPAKPCLFEEQGAGLGVCRRLLLGCPNKKHHSLIPEKNHRGLVAPGAAAAAPGRAASGRTVTHHVLSCGTQMEKLLGKDPFECRRAGRRSLPTRRRGACRWEAQRKHAGRDREGSMGNHTFASFRASPHRAPVTEDIDGGGGDQ